jgi:hypothetical protein
MDFCLRKENAMVLGFAYTDKIEDIYPILSMKDILSSSMIKITQYICPITNLFFNKMLSSKIESIFM